jgi:hypothetical protein
LWPSFARISAAPQKTQPLSASAPQKGQSRVKQPPALCQRLVTFLIPHPTDPQRVFSNLGCYAGRNRGTALVQSRDGGTTWSTSLPDGQNLYPERLVGGSGADRQRWYLTTSPIMHFSTPGVYGSDDDGASWTPILQDPAILVQPRSHGCGRTVVS